MTDTGSEWVTHEDFEAGPDQVLVVYLLADMSTELDPVQIFGDVATDASARAADGFRIISMTSVSLRHAGAMFGNDGSGYQTKGSVAVVYERVSRNPG